VQEPTKLRHAAQAQMPRIRVPAIIFHSTRDKILHPAAGKLAFARHGSADKELLALRNSGHGMIVDSEREMIFARTYGFLVAHAGAGYELLGPAGPAGMAVICAHAGHRCG